LKSLGVFILFGRRRLARSEQGGLSTMGKILAFIGTGVSEQICGAGQVPLQLMAWRVYFSYHLWNENLSNYRFAQCYSAFFLCGFSMSSQVVSIGCIATLTLDKG